MVSCLCITRNRPAFLEQAVRLFEDYTWPRKEMIVADDSDPGKFADLSGHPLVKHLKLDNGGKPDSFMGEKHNIAMAAAQGDVFAYHDDDDWFARDRLQLQLEPIVLGKATITGFFRDLVVKVPECTFWRFRPEAFRPRPHLWLKNGKGPYRLGLHDGTAMFHRSVLRHGILHPAWKVRQKVKFLDDLAGAGEKWANVKNDGHFVYVRHAVNTWLFEDKLVLVPAARPWWLPADVTDFWKGTAA